LAPMLCQHAELGLDLVAAGPLKSPIGRTPGAVKGARVTRGEANP
jgi:hypothetical protein